MSLLSALKSLFGFSSKVPKLAPGDRMLSCEDCQSPFVFDAGEQRFFKEKGFTDPKRCTRCRKKVHTRMRRRGGRGNGNEAQSQGSNPNRNNRGRNNAQQRGGRFSRRPAGIDGDSPYVDER